MDTLLLDLRFAARSLRKNQSFAMVAVLTLALGIGANAAMFAVVNAILLRPLPFADADRLVRVTGDLSGFGAHDAGLSPPELYDYRDRADLFESISGVYPIDAPGLPKSSSSATHSGSGDSAAGRMRSDTS